MKALVACEESQAVTIELRKLGVEAYSCDIQECSGGHPEWHLRQDVLPLLHENWDLIIAHPPCTYLTGTGNRWFNVERYGDKALQRIDNRKEAVEFFMRFANAHCDHIAIENPVGYMSTYWRKPDQIIQPWMYGDAAEKRTCLWLKGLPKLKETNVVAPPERVKYDSGRSMPKWYVDAWYLPKEERLRVRSKTFPGIAHAMATQWVSYIREIEGIK